MDEDELGRDPVEASAEAMDCSSPPPRPPPPEAEVRDWAELPRGVLSEVFRKVGTIDVMTGAQSVCRSWRELSWEPQTWRFVDMMHPPREMERHRLVELAKAVIARSNGLTEEFHAHSFVDDDLMRFIAERTNRLKCLRLKSCNKITDATLTELARRFSKLVYVEISLCPVTDEFVNAIGESCPRLKRFRLNREWYKDSDDDDEEYDIDDLEACSIADNMQELRHLQIFGNTITNKGLHAILDKCRKLESLDLRSCYNLSLDDKLKKKCARIRDLRLPEEEISDCEFAVRECDCDAHNSDSDSDSFYDNSETDDDLSESCYENEDEYDQLSF